MCAKWVVVRVARLQQSGEALGALRQQSGYYLACACYWHRGSIVDGAHRRQPGEAPGTPRRQGAGRLVVACRRHLARVVVAVLVLRLVVFSAVVRVLDVVGLVGVVKPGREVQVESGIDKAVGGGTVGVCRLWAWTELLWIDLLLFVGR